MELVVNSITGPFKVEYILNSGINSAKNWAKTNKYKLYEHSIRFGTPSTKHITLNNIKINA